MKRTIRSLALLFSLAVSFSACKKDSSDDIAANTLTYNGQSYNTIYARNESTGSSYSNFLVLSGNITSPTFSGKVSGVNIVFDFATMTEGTYTYKNDNDPSYDPKKNFFDATTFIGLNWPDLDGGEQLDNITAGTVTISKSGSNFNVSYNLDFDGKHVSGKYSGPVEQL